MVDAEGRALAGVRLTTQHDREVQPAISDSAGRVSLELYPGDYWVAPGPDAARRATIPLTFAGGGCVALVETAVVVEGEATVLGDVVLQRGGSLSGVVLDEAGALLEGALVHTHGGGMAFQAVGSGLLRDGPATVRSGPDGTFRLDGVAPGLTALLASLPGFLQGSSDPVWVRVDEVVQGGEIRLVPLPLERRLGGRVTDAAGRALPAAQVDWRTDAGTAGRVQAEGDGRFLVALPEDVSSVDLEVADRDNPHQRTTVRGVAPGSLDLLVVLAVAPHFELWVTSDDRSVDRFDYHLLDTGGRILTRGPGGASRDGYASIELPGEPFRVRVLLHGFRPAEAGPFDAEGPSEPLRLVLERVPGVSGRVLAQGRPLAGARVRLMAPLRERAAVFEGFRQFVNPHSGGETRSDDQGRFSAIPPQSRVYLRVAAEGYAARLLGPYDVDMAAGLSGLEVELDAGGSIAGVVRSPAGVEREGVLVGASFGDGFVRTVRSDDHGRYRFDALSPGPWQLRLAETELDAARPLPSYRLEPATDPPPADVVVEAGETAELDLVAGPVGWVRGRLRLAGEPPPAFKARLIPGEGEPSPEVAADSDGAFRLDAFASATTSWACACRRVRWRAPSWSLRSTSWPAKGPGIGRSPSASSSWAPARGPRPWAARPPAEEPGVARSSRTGSRSS